MERVGAVEGVRVCYRDSKRGTDSASEDAGNPVLLHSTGIWDNLVDQETRNGPDMTTYSALFEKAVDSVAAGLQSGRDFVIPERSAQANGSTDFELVTWLVIK